jgi:hypothetical protein
MSHNEPLMDITIIAANDERVGKIWIDDAPVEDFNATQRLNARRIVACVNACRGLPTDELEQKGIVCAVGNQLLDMDRKLHRAQTDAEIWESRTTKEASRAADLQAQVDELLAAAKHLLSNAMINSFGEWQGAFVEGTDITEYCQPLQDAINKITGETK